jgi:hypothetical protein
MVSVSGFQGVHHSVQNRQSGPTGTHHKQKESRIRPCCAPTKMIKRSESRTPKAEASTRTLAGNRHARSVNCNVKGCVPEVAFSYVMIFNTEERVKDWPTLLRIVFYPSRSPSPSSDRRNSLRLSIESQRSFSIRTPTHGSCSLHLNEARIGKRRWESQGRRLRLMQWICRESCRCVASSSPHENWCQCGVS